MSPALDLRTTTCTTLRTSGAVSGTTRLLSTLFSMPVLGRGAARGAILLKKKVGEEIALLLPPPSFDGTDKPRAPFITQSGGAR